jgi:hypothetical protein
MTTSPRNRPVIPRGRLFEKGNPGRRMGARHKSSIVAEKLMADECDAIVRAVIESAKGGDIQAAKVILDRIVPIRKGAMVQLNLPEVKTSRASTIGSVLEIRRRAIETQEIDERLKKLEEAKNGK